MNNRVLISGILATILIGCGSGEKGETKTDTEYYTDNVTKVGVFKDAPVEGLNYQTLTYKGVTDEDGHFKYKKGEYCNGGGELNKSYMDEVSIMDS